MDSPPHPRRPLSARAPRGIPLVAAAPPSAAAATAADAAAVADAADAADAAAAAAESCCRVQESAVSADVPWSPSVAWAAHRNPAQRVQEAAVRGRDLQCQER